MSEFPKEYPEAQLKAEANQLYLEYHYGISEQKPSMQSLDRMVDELTKEINAWRDNYKDTKQEYEKLNFARTENEPLTPQDTFESAVDLHIASLTYLRKNLRDIHNNVIKLWQESPDTTQEPVVELQNKTRKDISETISPHLLY